MNTQQGDVWMSARQPDDISIANRSLNEALDKLQHALQALVDRRNAEDAEALQSDDTAEMEAEE